MEVRIGIKESPKELEVELAADSSQDDLVKQIEGALNKDGHVLWLTDKRGRKVGVPGSKIAYVELGSPAEERRVGFAT